MKSIRKIFITTLSFAFIPIAIAQSTKLSLKEAIEYATANHPDIQNKILGEKYADAQLMETKSIGLPQLSANTQFINNIEKQVFFHLHNAMFYIVLFYF